MAKRPVTLDTLGDIKKPKRQEESFNEKKELLVTRPKTRRRSERVVQLNLKVTPNFYSELCQQADQEESYMVDILERALSSYIGSCKAS